jgi:hypothetical protein
LRGLLKPRVLLVHHEKSLLVDVPLTNLAIKYNMLYVSTHQVIKQHIEDKTDFGKSLHATKKPKHIVEVPNSKEDQGENYFSPVHFDLDKVI